MNYQNVSYLIILVTLLYLLDHYVFRCKERYEIFLSVCYNRSGLIKKSLATTYSPT